MSNKDMNQINLIKSLKLDQWFLKETTKPNSRASSFVASFIFNFVLKNVPEEKRAKFLNLVAEGEREEVAGFIQANIPDFRTKLETQLTKKLVLIKNKVLEN